MFSASGAAYLQVDMHATQGGGGLHRRQRLPDACFRLVLQGRVGKFACRLVFQGPMASIPWRQNWLFRGLGLVGRKDRKSVIENNAKINGY